ncbi:MAG: dihydroorotate dehydrogenase (NAD+) catalytic subunit [Planctomycetota bacterium]|jgi:dihydroorotate dehydrogenase (NAD+) catalytic subunit
MADLSVDLAGMTLRNPLLSASGTFGHGLEMQHMVAPKLLGGLVSKTVTMKPRRGNPMPRIAETAAGFLNSIGLENHGVAAYERDVLPMVAEADTLIIANLGGESVEEFAELAARLDGRAEIDAFEINLSCPNVDGGKLPYSTDPERAEKVMAGVRAATSKPIFAKLSPNVTHIGEIARGAEAGGADGITAVNTLLGMAVDWRSGRPALNTTVGGYSGAAIKPVALRCAWQCVEAVSIPVIGCGGIRTASDVLEYMVVGCAAVQIGTASFSDPSLLARLGEQLHELLDGAGIGSMGELRGRLWPHGTSKPTAAKPTSGVS